MDPRFAPEASIVHFIYYDREIPTADCFVFIILL